MKKEKVNSNRQIELLKKHYDIDEVNKIATINKKKKITSL